MPKSNAGIYENWVAIATTFESPMNTNRIANGRPGETKNAKTANPILQEVSIVRRISNT